MLALNPQTGESSGASLGVPSEALLHRHNAAVQYHRRCCLSALCSLCCPRPSPLRCSPLSPAPARRRRAHRTPHTVRHRRHRARLRSRLGDVKRRLDRPGHKRYGLSPFFRIKVESNENLSRRRPLFPLSGTTLRGFPFFERQRRRV